MSTLVETHPRTVQERCIDATNALREKLGLSDIKLLSAAIAEASAREISQNREFAQLVETLYQEMAISAKKPRASKTTKGTTRSKKTNAAIEDIDLIPINKEENYHIDAFATLNPHTLVKVYGIEQLPKALSRYSIDALKDASAIIEGEFPGTKPANRGRKDALITYIVSQLS